MQSNPNIIKPLTGIRFIAVLGIIFYHSNPFNGNINKFWFSVFNQFYIFVSFFFVLSGFLIYYRYSNIKTLNFKVVKHYFISRFARIMPLLLILLTFSYVVGYYNNLYNKPLWYIYLLNLSLLKGFSSNYYLTMIGPSWSLSVEMLFYITAPLIFFFANKKNAFWITILLIYTIGVLLYLLFKAINFQHFLDVYLFIWNYTFFGRIFEFMIGIYLAKLIMNEKVAPKFLRNKKRNLLFGTIIVATVVILLALIGVYFKCGSGNNSVIGALLHNLIMPIGITILFYALCTSNNILQKLLSSKLFQNLGNATYSIYLLHTSILLSVTNKYITNNIYLCTLIIIIVSFFIYKFIENPISNFIKKKFIANKP